MKYFFTSDEHYGHDNIIQYCSRPFSNTQEMDEEMIKRHNSVVTNKDIVIHAGDFTLRNTKEGENYLRRLNGEHIFIRGSHDKWREYLPYVIEKKIDGMYVVVCHYAMRTWPKMHYDSIQLFGHSHGTLPAIKNQLDIGVDSNDFYPITLEQIMKKIIENNKKLEILNK